MFKPLDQSSHQRTCPEGEAKEALDRNRKKGPLEKVMERYADWQLPLSPTLTCGARRANPSRTRTLFATYSNSERGPRFLLEVDNEEHQDPLCSSLASRIATEYHKEPIIRISCIRVLRADN